MSETLAATILRIMLRIAVAQPDPIEREAMLAILRADGWLPKDQESEAA